MLFILSYSHNVGILDSSSMGIAELAVFCHVFSVCAVISRLQVSIKVICATDTDTGYYQVLKMSKGCSLAKVHLLKY